MSQGYYDTFAPMGKAMLIGWMIFAYILLALILGIATYKKKEMQ